MFSIQSELNIDISTLWLLTISFPEWNPDTPHQPQLQIFSYSSYNYVFLLMYILNNNPYIYITPNLNWSVSPPPLGSDGKSATPFKFQSK